MNQNNLKVFARVMGLRPREEQFGAKEILEVEQNKVKLDGKVFEFDYLVKDQQIQFDNAIIEQDQWYITYGGTASGKTTALFRENGVIEQIGIKYFKMFKEATISIIEVQGPKIIDLLSKEEIKIVESERSFSGKNLSSSQIKSFDEFQQTISVGFNQRLVSSVAMNGQATRFPFLVKLDFGHFAIHFVDLIGSQSAKYCSNQRIKEIQYGNATLSVLQQIIKSNKESERLLLSNSNLLTKVIKNAFRKNSFTNWIVCLTTSSRSEKETLQTLSVFQ